MRIYPFISMMALITCSCKSKNFQKEKILRKTENINMNIPTKILDNEIRCPCVGSYEFLGDLQIQNVTDYITENTSIHSYGIGCAPHDSFSKECTEKNDCDVSILKRFSCDRGWCQASWCYVNASTCDLTLRKSVLFENRHYSYAACGFMDTFTNPYNITPLNGKVFNVAFASNSGGWKGAFNPEGSFAANNKWTGPMIDILKEAALIGDFVVNVTRPPDKLKEMSRVFFDSSSSFDYCVYAVALGYIDFCMSGFSITRKRTSVTPFFQAFTNDIYLILLNEEESSSFNKLAKILKPFTLGTWLAILSVLLFLGISMLLLEFDAPGNLFTKKISALRKEYNHDLIKHKRKKISIATHFTQASYRSCLAFFHLSYEQRIVTVEGKINLIAMSSFILVVVAIYTANLAAILTADIQKKKINSIEDAIHLGYNFCSTRNLALYTSEILKFDLNLVVPDPVELGGDGRPGFACPKCFPRERAIEQMRRTHSNSSLYCNAAIVYDQDLQQFHNSGTYCDRKRVVLLGKVGTGVPISSEAYDGLSSVFHGLNFNGVIAQTFLSAHPKSKCAPLEETNSLSISQIRGVWIFCGFFSFAALLTRFIRSKCLGFIAEQDHRHITDQWGNTITYFSDVKKLFENEVEVFQPDVDIGMSKSTNKIMSKDSEEIKTTKINGSMCNAHEKFA